MSVFFLVNEPHSPEENETISIGWICCIVGVLQAGMPYYCLLYIIELWVLSDRHAVLFLDILDFLLLLLRLRPVMLLLHLMDAGVLLLPYFRPVGFDGRGSASDPSSHHLRSPGDRG